MNLETLMDYLDEYRLQHAETYNLGLWQAATVNHIALLAIETALCCETHGVDAAEASLKEKR